MKYKLRLSNIMNNSVLARPKLPFSRFIIANLHTLVRRSPSAIIPNKCPKVASPEEAFNGLLVSNSTVFISAAAATPNLLIKPMVDYAKSNSLKNIKLCHMHLEGDAPFTDKSCEGIFRSYSFFMGKNVREAVAEGRADTVPVFLSEIPELIYRRIFDPKIAVISVSPFDKHGFCTMGLSVDCVFAGASCAEKIIALVNKKMPRTFGDSNIHISQVDVIVECDVPLKPVPPGKQDEPSMKIGKLIADKLVEDGCTLQMGIGNIPNAALASMKNHKHLGVHTEMFTDGLMPLIKEGIITNQLKSLNRGKVVTAFALGSQELYDYIDDNPSIEFKRVEYTNNLNIINKQAKMVAINSCIEIDLTGQVASDSIGTRMFSGFGGQVDFMRGSGGSIDGKGKPVITLLSQSKGRSKIVPLLKPGAGVVTSRAHVRYVVTEHGIADLYGKSLRQRAYELIKLADPAARESLEKAAFERLKVKPGPE